MKGTYVLILILPERKKIDVGALGEIDFEPGYYAYVGSALGGMEGRIGRHLKRGKRMRWHIDYLREEADVEEIWYMPGERREECRIAEIFRRMGFDFIPNFGSSDCRCRSHLFYSSSIKNLREALKKTGMKKW